MAAIPIRRARRRWLSPEVVQTSDTDCGPATLKCVLEGFGVRASYGRLREACQTDVDGTSIDAIEAVAGQLGLAADQMMRPLDHVLSADAGVLPAILVVRLPDGGTHFVVVWRRLGRFVQIMDPGAGRRWITAERLLAQAYIHAMPVPADEWRAWAASEPSLRLLRRQIAALGISPDALVDTALADSGWRALGRLDAAVRMTAELVRFGAVRRGREAARLLLHLCEHDDSIPAAYWSVQSRVENHQQVTLRGAVLVNIRGVAGDTASPASTELRAALAEPPMRPGIELLRLLRADEVLVPAVLVSALALAAGGVVTEAVLLRGFLELGQELELSGQRLAAVGALVTFLALLLALEVPLAAGLFRYGRRLEISLRQAFLQKIPRLSDRYFGSRLKSDMADRSHNIHRIRQLPELGSQLVRHLFELALTTAGIAWLDPASAPLAVAAAAAAALVPLAVQPAIMERDLRERNLGGALSRFYLDALLGVVTIRAHGAEQAVRRGHARTLGEWARAGLSLQRAVVSAQMLQLTAGYGLAVWLLFEHLSRRGEAGSVLLLAYWALHLPAIGQQIGSVAWQYPAFRNLTLRLLEPLGAIESDATDHQLSGADATGSPAAADSGSGARVAYHGVSIVAAGRTVLTDLSFDIEPGCHVAIVGASGAGKSTLVGVLLGWHRPSQGSVMVDGAPLDGRIERLRRQTAWIDPAVQLWNRSLYDNLRYGLPGEPSMPMSELVEAAHLRYVLEKLPNGFESSLGEGGALVSGGEGQRVRAGRALLRPDVRLAILDEPFRGLDAEQRAQLLSGTRALWKRATLLCITHDIAATTAFDRVLVLDKGRIVEDGEPHALLQRPGSIYRTMLDADAAAHEALWSSGIWRRLRLEAGQLHDDAREDVA